ncbi:MAG: hypothetical protein KF761_12440 [Salinibacterium sp.]|nr:hypothetical protein [Salinibacterium sp.]
MLIRVRAIAATGIVAVGILFCAPTASATEGSIPVEVSAFVTEPGGLIASLDDFFGPGIGGKGIAFDESTEFGRIDRVFQFSPAWLAGESTDQPVSLENRWTVPVSVGGNSIGVAIVWINPNTVRPQLADFEPDSAFAAALASIDDGVYLVNDEARGAWFVLDQPRLLVVVRGSSGVASQIPLASYQAQVTAPTGAVAPGDPLNLGSVLSVGTIVAVSLVVILVLLVPMAWRRRNADAEPDDVAPDDD